AADRAEVARVGDVEVPHRRPAAQDQAIEFARVHLLADRRPAAVALGERGRRIFHELAHGVGGPGIRVPRSSLWHLVAPRHGCGNMTWRKRTGRATSARPRESGDPASRTAAPGFPLTRE